MHCLLLGTLALWLCRTLLVLPCYSAAGSSAGWGRYSLECGFLLNRQGLNLKFNLATPSAAATRCQRSWLALRESSAPLLAHEPVANYRAHHILILTR